MQLTCPCCHAHVPLEAALQDEAGRELIGMLAALPADLQRPLVHYLAYFRPARQQLGWGRALRLMREVLALCTDVPALSTGLVEAALSLDDKRSAPGWKPLGNHNYLSRCLESVHARQGFVSTVQLGSSTAPHATAAPRSQGARALVALEGMKR